MNETDTDTAAVGGDKIIRLDEAQLRDHLDRKITHSVEETLNKLLDAEADQLCGAKRYERSPDRVYTRAGHYERKLPVALERAVKVRWNDVMQAGRATSRVPVVDGVAARNMTNPKVSLRRFTLARFKITDRRLIDLHVDAGHMSALHLVVNGLQPLGRQRSPPAQGLPGDRHAMATAVNLLLTIQRQVVDVFAGDDLRDQAWRSQTLFLQARGQRSDDGGGKAGLPMSEYKCSKPFSNVSQSSRFAAL